MKITIENQNILRRLQEKTSNYSVNKWEDDFRETEKRMKSMCEYPFTLFTDPTKAQYRTAVEDGRFSTAEPMNNGSQERLSSGLDTGLLSRGGLPRIGTGVSGQRSNNKSFTTIGGAGPSTDGKSKMLIKQAECLDENRIVLFKKGMQLGQGYYIVEISSNNSSIFIAAYDVETPESLLIELPEKKAEEILKEFSQDYEKMATCLQVMNKRLVLLNPKYQQTKQLQQRINSASTVARPRTQGGASQSFQFLSSGMLSHQALHNNPHAAGGIFPDNISAKSIQISNMAHRPDTAENQ